MPIVVVIVGVLIVVTAFGYSFISANREAESPAVTVAEVAPVSPKRN